MPKKILRFVFFIPILGFSVAGAEVKIASVRAHYSNKTVWGFEIRITGPNRCSAKVSDTDLKNADVTLSEKECQNLRAILSKVGTKPQRKLQTSLTIDEPAYDVQIDRRQPITLEFKTEEECELLATGKMHCQKILLSPIEKLIGAIRTKYFEIKAK
ncbi:MAG TPA: hypothetical protein VJB59_03860 [Bdellovibrionota bacterium]|nr:hypothetical protein [Bdellovibrionota bacterium]